MDKSKLRTMFRDRFGYDITEEIIVDASEKWDKLMEETEETMLTILKGEGHDTTKSPPAHIQLSDSSASLVDSHIGDYVEVFNSNPLLQMLFLKIDTSMLGVLFYGSVITGSEKVFRAIVEKV